MNNVNDLFEVITQKLRESKHSELLKNLLNVYSEGGSEAVDAKIKEILSKIEEE